MLIAARVVDIVLQKNSLISEELSKIPGGSHGSIGDIKFEYIGEGGRNRYGYAKPLSDHVKYYPVKNEVVLLIKAPSKGFYISRSNVHNYYLSTVNLWKNQNHNALPKESKNITEADIKSESVVLPDAKLSLSFNASTKNSLAVARFIGTSPLLVEARAVKLF